MKKSKYIILSLIPFLFQGCEQKVKEIQPNLMRSSYNNLQDCKDNWEVEPGLECEAVVNNGVTTYHSRPYYHFNGQTFLLDRNNNIKSLGYRTFTNSGIMKQIPTQQKIYINSSNNQHFNNHETAKSSYHQSSTSSSSSKYGSSVSKGVFGGSYSGSSGS